MADYPFIFRCQVFCPLPKVSERAGRQFSGNAGGRGLFHVAAGGAPIQRKRRRAERSETFGILFIGGAMWCSMMALRLRGTSPGGRS